jgi:hypothetical protein
MISGVSAAVLLPDGSVTAIVCAVCEIVPTTDGAVMLKAVIALQKEGDGAFWALIMAQIEVSDICGVGPSGPCGPTGPCGPCVPCGPGGPVIPAAEFKNVVSGKAMPPLAGIVRVPSVIVI